MFRKLVTAARSWMQSSAKGTFRKSPDAEALFRKYESLVTMLGTVRATSGYQPESFYRELTLKISGLFQAESTSVLVPDAVRRVYLPLCVTPDHVSNRGNWHILEQDEIIREFHAGKNFVCSAAPCTKGSGRSADRQVSCCYFPIMVDKKIEAILFLAARMLAASDVQMISGFCRQASLVIQNQKMYRDLSGRLNHAASIADALSAFTRVQNEKELLRTILDTSAELLKADQGSLILVDQEDQVLLLKAKKGVIQGVNEEFRMKAGEGITGRVVELGEPMLVENVEMDPRTNRKNRHHYRTRSFLSVPIKVEDRIIGVINLADKQDGSSFTDEDLKLMQSIATQAAVVMERNLLQNQIEELKKLSTTDPLTGLLNRRHVLERLKAELARSDRRNHELSILMLDLDGFKHCNDTLGHLFGDKILILIAEILLRAVRSMDMVARYGGDEFLILLPETSREVAAQIAERIRATVEEITLSRETSDTPLRLSASIGLVGYPRHGETLEALLSNADKALYCAKNNGKNRIEILISTFPDEEIAGKNG